MENQLSPHLLLLVFFWHSDAANTAPFSCFFLTKQSKFLPGTMLLFKVHWLAGIKPQEIVMTEVHLPLYYSQFSTVQGANGITWFPGEVEVSDHQAMWQEGMQNA